MPHNLCKILRDPPSGSVAILEKLMGFVPPPLTLARVEGGQDGAQKPGTGAKNKHFLT